MNLQTAIKKVAGYVRRKGLLDSVGASMNITAGVIDYYLNPYALRSDSLPKLDCLKIRKDMEIAGLRVVPYHIDVPTFGEWLGQAAFPDYYMKSYGDLFIEKALEHFVGANLLGLCPGKTLIDVASSSSPWMNIATRLYGVTAVAIDLHSPKTLIQGHKLAADATAMPFASGTVDSLTLHCAYEMFEGDADIRLFSEASRVLRLGGKMVILPLYMHHLYHIDSSPAADRRRVDYQDATRVWRENPDGRLRLGGVRFSRKYDVTALMERVIHHKGPLSCTIHYIENEIEVDLKCYLKFVAVFEKVS